MAEQKFPFEDHLLELEEGDETVIWIHGRAFIVTPATIDDIERIGKGYFCLE